MPRAKHNPWCDTMPSTSSMMAASSHMSRSWSGLAPRLSQPNPPFLVHVHPCSDAGSMCLRVALSRRSPIILTQPCVPTLFSRLLPTPAPKIDISLCARSLSFPTHHAAMILTQDLTVGMLRVHRCTPPYSKPRSGKGCHVVLFTRMKGLGFEENKANIWA
jgi:hypothetical protein